MNGSSVKDVKDYMILHAYFIDMFANYKIKTLKKVVIGKKHALKKYDQFALSTSCFWGSTGSNIIPPVVQFHGIFVTKK